MQFQRMLRFILYKYSIVGYKHWNVLLQRVHQPYLHQLAQLYNHLGKRLLL